MRGLVLCLILPGCTVSVVDERLPREEVAIAFQQRDRSDLAVAHKVNEIETRVAELEKKLGIKGEPKK